MKMRPPDVQQTSGGLFFVRLNRGLYFLQGETCSHIFVTGHDVVVDNGVFHNRDTCCPTNTIQMQKTIGCLYEGQSVILISEDDAKIRTPCQSC